MLVLDQVTDPHNVGAIMRSAVAFGVERARHHEPPLAAEVAGVLAKSASGALEHDRRIVARAQSCRAPSTELASAGLPDRRAGQRGRGDRWKSRLAAPKIGAGAGSRGQGPAATDARDAATTLARIDLPGEIRSLNVSNAAVLSLYIARRHVDGAR